MPQSPQPQPALSSPLSGWWIGRRWRRGRFRGNTLRAWRADWEIFAVKVKLDSEIQQSSDCP
jgi:hypothetical protein